MDDTCVQLDPVGLPMPHSMSDEDIAQLAKIAKEYYGETEENREATIDKLKTLLLAQNSKVMLTEYNYHICSECYFLRFTTVQTERKT